MSLNTGTYIPLHVGLTRSLEPPRDERTTGSAAWSDGEFLIVSGAPVGSQPAWANRLVEVDIRRLLGLVCRRLLLRAESEISMIWPFTSRKEIAYDACC